jgi:hypothetical protein
LIAGRQQRRNSNPVTAMSAPSLRTIHGEPSFQLTTAELDLAVTARGGQLAPVVFHLPGRDVSPYALAPWEPSEFPEIPPLLAVLRGDFLCLPFGGQPHGPPHGDPANAEWSLVAANDKSLALALTAADSGASIEKSISVRPGQHAIYLDHRIANLDGDFNYGTHPILDFSGLPEGAGRISTSPMRWSSTFPGPFSDPAAGESQALAESAEFTDLSAVALAAGGTTDLSRYPARLGNDDLVMMVNEPTSPSQPFAWSAAVFDGWLWFSLKNPVDFPATLLWLSNGGRTAAPWLCRHTGRLGIEDVCSYFSHGYETSRTAPLAHLGIPTTRSFSKDQPVSLRVIQAVAAVPVDFGAVAQILPCGDAAVTIVGTSGQQVQIPLDWGFVL